MTPSLLAQANLPVPTGDFIMQLLGCVAIALHIAALIKNFLTKKKTVPQPLETVEVTAAVTQGSYHTHCRINREEHARIERELAAKIEKVSDLHHELVREVSGVIKTLEQNGLRLVQMDTKLDRILIHQSAPATPKK